MIKLKTHFQTPNVTASLAAMWRAANYVPELPLGSCFETVTGADYTMQAKSSLAIQTVCFKQVYW